MIYVVASPDRKCVKIGFSNKRPVERCEDLEASHPSILVPMLILRGDKSVERHFHNRFEALRIRREWFRKEREIDEWMRSEDGIVTCPFYEWLLLRRNDAPPIGTFACYVLEDANFPKEAKNYLVLEDHLRVCCTSSETRELFDKAWRAFLRCEARKEVVARSVTINDVHPGVPRPERRPPAVRRAPVRPEHIAYVVNLFNCLMPQALMKNAERAQAIDTILCFKIEGSGEWTIDCSNETPLPTCTRGVSNRALCTVEIEIEGFVAMLFDPNAGMKLYFQKKLRLSGDLAQAPKVAALFELVALEQRQSPVS